MVCRSTLSTASGDDGDGGDPASRQLQSLDWNYPRGGANDESESESILAEINGFRVADGAPVSGFHELAADGSTACGCWIYSGIMPARGVNRSKARQGDDHASAGWGYAWPANRRILYNRASAAPDGRPWSERKAWIWWDEETAQWTGYDEPDFPSEKGPAYQSPPGATGIATHGFDSPFIMLHDGKAQLFAATGLVDGPLPVHYEAWESPVVSRLHPPVSRSPAAIQHLRDDNPYHDIADERYPYVLTTYRLTEHHTAGGMSRFVPWLAELQPEGFAEIDPVLARQLGIEHGSWVVISTARGAIQTKAMVTVRLQPLLLADRLVHQIALPWHFGFSGIATGGIANDLSALIADPNSLINEAKAFTCDLRKGQLDER